MTNLLKIGLTAYVAYLPILTIIIGYIALRKPHFIPHRQLLSTLGETGSTGHFVVDSLISIFGFLGFFLAWSLSETLPNYFSTKFGVFFLFLTNFSIFLVGFFPRDLWRKIHGYLGTLAFSGLTAGLLLLTRPMLDSPFIPKALITLNLGVVLPTVLHLFFIWRSKRKPIRKIWAKTAAFSQWMMLLMAVLWSFLIGLVVLKSLF